MDNLEIKVMETDAHKHENPPLMEGINLKHPFSVSVFGNTGSGKTVLTLNLLTNKHMFGEYFDEVHLFGLTARSDSSWEVLKLPDKFIHDKPHSLISDLRALLNERKADVKRVGVHKSKKVCIVFEDATANRKLLNSAEYIESYVQNRHYGISVIACCHKYHAQTRVCRLNSNHIMLFPATPSEINRLCSELQPSFLSKKEFIDAIRHCFEPDEECSHPFMWLNFKSPERERIRKTLKHGLQFAGKQHGQEDEGYDSASEEDFYHE